MIDTPFREFVDALAARTPTPGGGAAAACTGTMGAALLAMVLRFAKGKKGAEKSEANLDRAVRKLEVCIEKMMPMADRDMASFERVASAYKLPSGTEEAKIGRSRAIQEALAGAIVVPEELLHFSRDALRAASDVADSIGRSIVADLGAGSELLVSAARAAALLVRINSKYLQDRDIAHATIERADGVLRETVELRDRLGRVVEERMA